VLRSLLPVVGVGGGGGGCSNSLARAGSEVPGSWGIRGRDVVFAPGLVVGFLGFLGQDWFREPRFGWSAGAASSLVGATCSPASCGGEVPVERRFGAVVGLLCVRRCCARATSSFPLSFLSCAIWGR
jgi:hypothetical protein